MFDQIVIRYRSKKSGKRISITIPASAQLESITVPATVPTDLKTLAIAKQKGMSVNFEGGAAATSDEDGPALCYKIGGDTFFW